MILLPLLLSLAEIQSPAKLYERVSAAVVGIDCWAAPPAGSEDPFAFGTGAIIDPGGLVLTSITVVPPEARRIRVRLAGGRNLDAERVRSVPEKELVLLRLRPPAGQAAAFPFLRLGDSSRLRVGQLAYSLGNAFRSISDDDQVSLAAGVISGGYTLTETRSESRYLGPAIETTAAVNDGMDGGPLVNSGGELVGLISLNYSKSRWLGTAVPIDVLKPFMADELGWFSDRVEPFPAYLGIEISPAALLAAPAAGPAAGGADAALPVVVRVEPGSPASRAGIREDDRIAVLDGAPVASGRDFRDRFRKLKPGERIKLALDRRGERVEVEARLWGRY